MFNNKSSNQVVVLILVFSLSFLCFAKPAKSASFNDVTSYLYGVNNDLVDAWYWVVQEEMYDSYSNGQKAVYSVVYAFEDSVMAFQTAYEVYYSNPTTAGWYAMEYAYNTALHLFDCAVSSINALALDSNSDTTTATLHAKLAAKDLLTAMHWSSLAGVGF